MKTLFVFNFLFWVLVPFYTFAQTGKYRIISSESIFFESGKADLSPNYYPVLETAAKLIQSNKITKLWVHSHTDSVGSESYNDSLSAARAASVLVFLTKKTFLDTARIQVRNYGEYSPLADDGDEKGRAENRRVMVYVVEPATQQSHMQIQGRVVDAKTQAPIAGAKLIFVDTYGRKDSVETDSAGAYQHTNPRIENVEVRTYAKGYFFVSKIAQKSNQPVSLNFSLEPCIIGAKLALQNLYFFGGNAQLTPASEAGLEGILAFLNLNDALKIEIGGHVNKPNAPACEIGDASHKLSEARAQAVYKYLIDKGIRPQRLSFKGYANWEMIYPAANNSIQEQLNRRVELKIIP